MNQTDSYEKMIPEELVRATGQFFAHANLEESRAALKEFEKKQPNVVEFVTALGKELSEEGRNLLVYLAMVLWKIFDSAAEGNFPLLDQEELEKNFEAIEDFFLQEKDQSEDEILTRFQEKFPIRQPFVYQFLFQKLLQPEDNRTWPENELLLLFISLSSLLNSFSERYENMK
ncbi:MAG: hypothetical protein GXO76_04870 [Calditrichaeota bacterium]|nr:hypothetical protein [Calditrichota bacterium]